MGGSASVKASSLYEVAKSQAGWAGVEAKAMAVGGKGKKFPDELRLKGKETIVMMNQSVRAKFGQRCTCGWKARRCTCGFVEQIVSTGALAFGSISGSTLGMHANHYEYTVAVEDNVTYCVEEENLYYLQALPGLPWLTHLSRDVAVQVETHGKRRFAAILLYRNEDGKFQVKFRFDQSIIDSIPADHLFEPDADTLYNSSPECEPPDPLWLLDRKIQADIDAHWPMHMRIEEALLELRICRTATTEALRGPFVGRGLCDSENFPTHPSPMPDLIVNGMFVDTWSKYAGRIKFATTYRCGPKYPGFSDWIESLDAGDPVYFHAALPVYAGLICLGNFPKQGGQPEWIRASDVALVGIALYVNDELQPGFSEPPLEKKGVEKYGHECCHFIPGCASTYLADMAWVGAVFCLAPTEEDKELRDDVYNIEAYHQILREWDRLNRERGMGRDIVITVNLILSTNYLANVRQVCSGQIRVTLSEKGLMTSKVRMRDILENRLDSYAAHHPRRPRKVLSEVTYGQYVDGQHPVSSNTENNPRMAAIVQRTELRSPPGTTPSVHRGELQSPPPGATPSLQRTEFQSPPGTTPPFYTVAGAIAAGSTQETTSTPRKTADSTAGVQSRKAARSQPQGHEFRPMDVQQLALGGPGSILGEAKPPPPPPGAGIGLFGPQKEF